MQTIIETERLTLRKFVDNEEDGRFIMELVNTEDWIKNIGDRNVHSMEDASNYIKGRLFKAYEKEGYGFFMMENKTTHEKLGTAGILIREHMECPDFGYGLLPQYYRKGFAFEISTALLDYARSVLKLEKIQAIVNNDNIPSIELLKKCGLSFVKTLTLDDGLDVDLYEKKLDD